MKRIVEENINTLEYWQQRHGTEPDFNWDCQDIPMLIARRAPNNVSILDVGLGGAAVFRKLREIRPDLRYSGCDFSEAAIRRLQTWGFDNWIEPLFVHNIYEPIPGTWDIVISTEMLEHLEQPEEAVRNMERAARLKVIVTVPLLNRIESPEHIWEYSENDLLALLRPFGRSVEIVPCRGYQNVMGVIECR